jgi:rubrerythrin
MLFQFYIAIPLVIACSLLLSWYVKKKMMDRLGVNDLSFNTINKTMSTANTSTTVNYSCMSCGKRHTDYSCPECGSKMKKASF